MLCAWKRIESHIMNSLPFVSRVRASISLCISERTLNTGEDYVLLSIFEREINNVKGEEKYFKYITQLL